MIKSGSSSLTHYSSVLSFLHKRHKRRLKDTNVRWHGGAVRRIVASQLKGPGFDLELGILSVLEFHMGFIGGFLVSSLLQKNMPVREVG